MSGIGAAARGAEPRPLCLPRVARQRAGSSTVPHSPRLPCATPQQAGSGAHSRMAATSSSEAGPPAEERSTGGNAVQLFQAVSVAGPPAFWRQLGPLPQAVVVLLALLVLLVAARWPAAALWAAAVQQYADHMERKVRLAWRTDRVSCAALSCGWGWGTQLHRMAPGQASGAHRPTPACCTSGPVFA